MAIVAAITVGTELAQKIKPLAKAAEKFKSLINKIPIGGVDDDRFMARRDQMNKIFSNAKYLGYTGEFKEHGLSESQIPEHKKTNYFPEYQKLRQWVIWKLNKYNPGLGDAYGAYFPNFPMEVYKDGEISKGQMGYEPIAALQDFVDAYKPGTYKGDLPLPDRSTPQAYSDAPDLTKSKLAVNEQGTDDFKLTEAGFGNMNIIVIVVLILIALWYFSK